MSYITIQAEGWKCDCCGHTWSGKGQGTPIMCPVCKSKYWDGGKPTKQVKESKQDYEDAVLIKSEHGVKLEKHNDVYIVKCGVNLEKHNDVYIIKCKHTAFFKSYTWASKRFDRHVNVFQKL
jgi:hypothetical protein